MGENIIDLVFERVEGKPVVSLKVCPAFRSFLDRTNTKAKERVFNSTAETNVYKDRLFKNVLDDFTKPVFYNNELNRAILRIVPDEADGGLMLDLSRAGVISNDLIEKEIKKFLGEFKTFYKDNISKVRIKASLEQEDI